MCERDQIDEWDRSGAFDWGANRRQFALGAMGVLGACASRSAGGGGGGLAEEWVRVTTPDGVMDAFFVRPTAGRHPAILTWPDIMGVREAYKLMARRMAAQGHAVLVINHYYRAAPAPQFDRGYADFVAKGGFDKVRPWHEALTADAIGRDAAAAIAWLDRRPEVDTERGVGTDGYCLGGPFTVWTAVAVPGRVRAAASLHGWRLVTDQPQSPHRLLGSTKARFLFAIGENDDKEAPEEKNELRRAAAAAGRPSEVEVYPAAHGWMLMDGKAYDAAAAERAWARMSALFATL
jgi:carboxymethylenebutenolidase